MFSINLFQSLELKLVTVHRLNCTIILKFWLM